MSLDVPVTHDFTLEVLALAATFRAFPEGGEGASTPSGGEDEGEDSDGFMDAISEPSASAPCWKLRFPTRESGEAFMSALNLKRALVADASDAGAAAAAGGRGSSSDVFSLVPHGGFSLAAFERSTTSWDDAGGADPLPPPASAARASPSTSSAAGSPARARLVGSKRRDEAVRALALGAGERSFLLRDGGVDVVRNVMGGVEDLSMRVKLDFSAVDQGPEAWGGAGTPAAAARSMRLRSGKAVGESPAATPSRRATRSAADPSAPASAPASTPPPSAGRASGRPPLPLRALLAGRERRMDLLTPGASSRLVSADLETERIVGTWGFSRDGVDQALVDVVGETKASQLEDNDLLLGIGNRSVGRWDLRTKAGAVDSPAPKTPGRAGRGASALDGDDAPSLSLAQSLASPSAAQWVEGRSYAARGPKFTCAATSGEGHVVVGASDGSLRLYSAHALGTAKTAIAGLDGRPITAVDVTYNADWVVATTDAYIIVLKTTYIPTNGTKPVCGFTSRMGANAPAPKLLRLKPEDAMRAKNAPLRNGRFSWVTAKNSVESYVVASAGDFLARWSFRHVKAAPPRAVGPEGLVNVIEYAFIPANGRVVDAKFVHEKYARRGSEIVEATRNALYAVKDEDEDDLE